MRRAIFLALLAAALLVGLDAHSATRTAPQHDVAESVVIGLDHASAAARGTGVFVRAELAVLLSAVTLFAFAPLGLAPAARAAGRQGAKARRDRSRAPPTR